MQSIARRASKDERPRCGRAVALRGSPCGKPQDEHLRVTVRERKPPPHRRAALQSRSQPLRFRLRSSSFGGQAAQQAHSLVGCHGDGEFIAKRSLNPRLLNPKCLLPCTYRHGISVRIWEGHGHEIVIEPCRAFNHRSLVDYPAVRPGRIANPDRLRRHASPCHGRCAETGGKAARVGAGSKHNGAASDCVNHSNGNRAHAFLCTGFCDGEDSQPGESRQQLQRWLCIKLPARQGAVDRMQRVGRQCELWTLLANVPRHHHPFILRELRRDEGVPGRVSKQSPLVLQQPAGRQQVQGRRSQALRTSLVHTARRLLQALIPIRHPEVRVARCKSIAPGASKDERSRCSRAVALRGSPKASTSG